MTPLRSSDPKPLFATNTAANIRIVIFVIASVVLMTLDHRHHHLETVRTVLSTLLYPLQYSVQLPWETARRLSAQLASRRTLVEENAQLREQQLLLNFQLQQLATLEAENRRLRILLESAAHIKDKAIIAELLTADLDPYRHQILLNKGTYHGVRIGQPLLDQHGVIGQIIHATPLSATAILITDPNHSLPVQVVRNGLRTLAVGSGNFQALELPYVSNKEDVQVGDVLVTSGLGGRFPRGYPVATVSRVESDPNSPFFARVIAQPMAQLDRTYEFLVIVGGAEQAAGSLSAHSGP